MTEIKIRHSLSITECVKLCEEIPGVGCGCAEKEKASLLRLFFILIIVF